MKYYRINALVIRHLYLFKRSVPRIMDILYWPIMELLLWGFISVYMGKLNIAGFNAITVLLGAVIFWDLLSQSQRSVSVSFLEDVWEKNFVNIFVTPLKISEFLMSTIVLGAIRIFAVGIVMGVLAFLFFHFNIFTFGILLVPFMLSLLVFGSILGLFTTGIILRYGTSAQVLAFGFIFLIQPFSAVFYPVSALPASVQFISYLLPSTYIFEGMRDVIASGSLPPILLFHSFLLNFVYLVAVVWYFYKMFSWVKNKGLLLKLN